MDRGVVGAGMLWVWDHEGWKHSPLIRSLPFALPWLPAVGYTTAFRQHWMGQTVDWLYFRPSQYGCATRHGWKGRTTMKLAAIFFDLDGTLCLPTTPFATIFERCCTPLLSEAPERGFGALLAFWSAALLQPGPSTTSACFGSLLAACGIAGNGEQRAADMAVCLNAAWAESQAVLPGAYDVLGALGEHWPLGLITNGPADAQRAVIAQLDLARCFHWLLVSGDPDLGVRKPDPWIFRHAARLAGCPPEASLYVGDSAVNDIGGAAAAGFRTCWFNPSGQPLPPKVPAPDLTIRDLRELPALLGC